MMMKLEAKMKSRLLGLCIVSLCVCMYGHTVIQPRPMSVDSRLQVINYKNNDVIKFTGFYNYQSIIEFAEGEEIDNISMGDTTGWQVVPINHRIFLKPVEDEALTNMTVITNKRLYYFELHAMHAESIDDPRLVFNMKFLYPDEGYDDMGFTTYNQKPTSLDLDTPEKYNFNYTISGEENISPIKLFDDGEFTYIQFRDKNTDIPAVFVVGNDDQEAMVNYRISGEYVVIERVASRMTLRRGKDVACVFNEASYKRR